MSGVDYARAKAIFLEASRLPRGERTRFLRDRCGVDGALEGHVRRLLTMDEEDGGFLESPVLEPQTAVETGMRLGPFRVLRVLGEGGMGIVYEAQQEEPDRRVALKLVRHGFFSERLRARFRHEIRVLGHLRHPGIAQIYEAGTLVHAGEHVPYFAMELVEGEPLLRWGAGMGVRERLALVAQICDAVHHAHQKGVVHRDLKPGNILVEAAPTGSGTDGGGTAVPFQVKVLDFGVSRAIDTDIVATSAHTQAGQLIGTLPYMSPEQAAGDADAIDIRSDVYSIGVIACEVLTGRLPYEVEGKILPEAARVIREQEPIRMSLIDRSLRGDVETIVRKALQKDRRARYQSAAEMGADIRRYLRDEPIVARAPSALYQLRKFARRHRPLVGAAAFVAVAMVAATGVSMWQARVADRARVLAEGEQRRADLAAAAAKREAQRATLAGAAAAIANRDPITATRLLDNSDEDSRGWAWRYWRARLDDSVALVRPGGSIAAAWMSPDGGEVAVVTGDGVVRRGSPWAGELSEVARLAESPVSQAVFVDGSRRIITNGPDRRTPTMFDAADGRVLQRHEPLEAPIGTLEASFDGRSVFAALRRPGRPRGDAIALLRAATPGGPWSGTGQLVDWGVSCGAFSGDGKRLAFASDAVHAWDVEAPASGVLASLARGARCIAVTNDGGRIATGGIDKTIGLWDGATGARVRSFGGHTGIVTALAFDPSGHLLASAGTDLTVRVWDTAGGQALATFVGLTGVPGQLQLNADGSLLMSISGDGSLRIWKRDPYEGACVLRGHSSYVYDVAFTPDGLRILSGAWDETLRAWGAADGRPLDAIPVSNGIITALRASHDGRTLATGHKIDGSGRVSSVLLWDAAAMRPIGEPVRSLGEIGDVIFSADGTRVFACRGSSGVDEFDVTTSPPARRAVVTVGATISLALSPDGRDLACGDLDGSISIVRAASGEVVRRFEGHRNRIRSVAFHPVRPLLASASDDGTARLWDLATGHAAELLGHADMVYAAAFSPDGQILATGSEDTTIALWDVETGDELARLRGHDAYVYALAYSPDGSMLVSGSGDHTVRVWDTRPVHQRWRGLQDRAESARD